MNFDGWKRGGYQSLRVDMGLCTSDSLLVNRDVNNITSYGLYTWVVTRHLKVHGL